MPCFNTALTRSANIKTAVEKKTNKKKQKQKTFFTAKTQHLNLKASSNNLKAQSDKILTAQIYVFNTTKQMGFDFIETR